MRMLVALAEALAGALWGPYTAGSGRLPCQPVPSVAKRWRRAGRAEGLVPAAPGTHPCPTPGTEGSRRCDKVREPKVCGLVDATP